MPKKLKDEAGYFEDDDMVQNDDVNEGNPLDDDDQDDLEDDQDDLEDDQDDEDEDEDDDDEDEDEDQDDDEDDEREPAPRGKKKPTARERIAELTAARKAAELAQYNAEVALQEAQAARETEPKQKQAGPDLPKAPNPDDYEFGKVDDKYVDDLVEYKAAVKTAERMKEFESTQTSKSQEEANAHYNKRITDVMADGEKKHAGFTDIINNVRFDAHLARSILDSEYAVDILWKVSNDIPELKRLAAMAPDERLRYIGRLEGRYSAPSAARKKTKAPAPLGSRDSRRKTRKSKAPGKYGSDDQDQFDKQFFA